MTVPPVIIWEGVTCSLCGSDRSAPFIELPDRVHQVAERCCFRRCRVCGLVYLDPRPNAASFQLIYPDEYGPYQPVPVDRATLHSDIRRTCAFVHRLQPQGGRLLDIGCGPGTFLQAMQLIYPNWNVVGLEPDARAVGYAQKHGLDVQQGNLDTATLPAGHFAAVTLWNVFEHLPDPRAALERIRTLLAPDGMIHLALPLCDSWDARLWRSYWMGWDPPRHFVLYDRTTLQRMLASEGFTMVDSACVSGTEYCFTESLRLFIHGRIQGFALQRLAVATSYSRPFRLCIRPYVVLAEWMQRSTVLTIAARKL